MLFSVGIILVVSGLKLNSITIPMTSEEIVQYHKEMSESKFCHGITCPSPPFLAKSPYRGIGQVLYYLGTSSLVSGSIISIRNRISISRQFVPQWIFFIGSIMTTTVLLIMPIHTSQLLVSFCIDPLCPPVGGPYFTTDPAIVEPLLYFGIIISIAGGITYLIKMSK